MGIQSTKHNITMKRFTFLALAVLKITTADKNSILGALKYLEAYSQNMTVAELDASAGEDRAFGPTTLAMFNQVDGYGCWCNFNEDYVLSKGPVQDPIDALCKRLVNGYHCGIHDGAVSGEPCQTNSEPYSVFNFILNAQTVEQFCTTNPFNAGDDCKETACIVEGAFALELFAGMFGGNLTPDPNLKHSGIFDPAVECVSAGGQGASQKDCCGAYPDRYPFKHFSNSRACCGQVTYAVANLQCCGDNSLIDNQSTC